MCSVFSLMTKLQHSCVYYTYLPTIIIIIIIFWNRIISSFRDPPEIGVWERENYSVIIIKTNIRVGNILCLNFVLLSIP